MIGLDTDVLVRFFARDQPEQVERADALLGRLTEQEPGFVSVVSLVELVWVLRKGHGYDRSALATLLRAVADAPELVLEADAAVAEATRRFASGGPGFADHLLAALHRRAGVTRSYSFDRVAACQSGWSLVPDLPR